MHGKKTDRKHMYRRSQDSRENRRKLNMTSCNSFLRVEPHDAVASHRSHYLSVPLYIFKQNLLKQTLLISK
jgi:hypothetical protein